MKHKVLLRDFKKFLKEYKLVSIGVGFVMAQAVNELVASFVNNIFMPLADPFIPRGTWENATFAIGPFEFEWGLFLSALIHFTILAVLVFFLVRFLIRDEKEKKE